MSGENYDTVFKVGSKVLISPSVINMNKWEEATVIEVEQNPFNGIVIAAKTALGDIFFNQQRFFKLAS